MWNNCFETLAKLIDYEGVNTFYPITTTKLPRYYVLKPLTRQNKTKFNFKGRDSAIIHPPFEAPNRRTTKRVYNSEFRPSVVILGDMS